MGHAGPGQGGNHSAYFPLRWPRLSFCLDSHWPIWRRLLSLSRSSGRPLLFVLFRGYAGSQCIPLSPKDDVPVQRCGCSCGCVLVAWVNLPTRGWVTASLYSVIFVLFLGAKIDFFSKYSENEAEAKEVSGDFQKKKMPLEFPICRHFAFRNSVCNPPTGMEGFLLATQQVKAVGYCFSPFKEKVFPTI